MSTFKIWINSLRKNILLSLMKYIGASSHQNGKPIDRVQIKRVLIIRPNHRLGNQLMMTPVVQEILETFPNCQIDLFAGKVSPVLFKNYERIDRIITLPRKPFKELFKYLKTWLNIWSRRYDIAINVTGGSSSGRLATKFARATYKVYGNDENTLQLEHVDYYHLAKTPVYNFRYFLSELGIADENKKIPCLDIKLSVAEIAEGKKILESLIHRIDERTICLYTFATGAKCYSESWWTEFHEKLKAKYTNFNIIEILPVENISMIKFKAPTFYSKDIREMGAVMTNTAIWIGADCGIMHLASASNVPTLGFFSVTNANSYIPYNKNSKALITTESTMDDIFSEIDKILTINSQQ